MFQLSSKIIDFIVIETDSEPDSLIILSEEEIVFIDLLTPGWPEFLPPSLVSLHASAVTCLSLFSSVSPDLLTRLCSEKTEAKFSPRAWPVKGGECDQTSPDKPSLIVTGEFI